MALVIDIADAVVAELEQGAFSQAFAPQREVLPSFELSELSQLKVTVVPKAMEINGATRSMHSHDVQIDIGMQQHLGKDLDSEVSMLCSLVDEIAGFLRKRPLQNYQNAIWVHTVNEPVYAPEHLSQQRLFTSVLTLTYRVLQ